MAHILLYLVHYNFPCSYFPSDCQLQFLISPNHSVNLHSGLAGLFFYFRKVKLSWLGKANYFSSDERRFTQVLVHKMHSSLTAKLDLLTQMQSCPAEVIAICKGLSRKESCSYSLPALCDLYIQGQVQVFGCSAISAC